MEAKWREKKSNKEKCGLVCVGLVPPGHSNYFLKILLRIQRPKLK